MAAAKRPEAVAVPVTEGDGIAVATSSSQPRLETPRTAGDILRRSSEPSIVVEVTNQPRRHSLMDGRPAVSSSLSGDADGTSSRQGSRSSQGIQPIPLAPANTLGSGATSKSTATAVEEPPRENLDAVRIRQNSTDPRCGITARHYMAADHRIIYETPLMSCEKPRWHWRGHHITALAWTTLSRQTRDELQHGFIGLRGLSTETGLSGSQRRQLEGFVKKYATADTSGNRVHIYNIASHINHACGRCANARAWADSDRPNYMSITLLRPVREGEEILINYGKGHPPCFVYGTRRRYKASENQRRDTHVNPPQQRFPQPQEAQRRQDHQETPGDHQELSEDQPQPYAEDQEHFPTRGAHEPGEDQEHQTGGADQPAENQEHLQARAQRIRRGLRTTARLLFGPDETLNNARGGIGAVGVWGM